MPTTIKRRRETEYVTPAAIAYCSVNVLVPAVRPVITAVFVIVAVTLLLESEAAQSLLAATVPAPDTATLVRESAKPVVLDAKTEMKIKAVVPVTRVTEGLVPGDPLKVAVYDAEVVVPVAPV